MKKKFKLNLCRVISRFQTCREKTSAALPPAFFLSPSNPKKHDIEFPAPPPPPQPSPTRRLATVVASTAGCRSCVPVTDTPASLNLLPEVDLEEDDLSMARGTPAYLWRKEEKWHVVTCAEEVERRRRKIDREEDEEDEDDDDLFTSISARRRRREIEVRRRRRCRKSKSKSRNSTSSVASGSWFSSDDDEQNDEREDDDGDDTDTLLSSRSFSTDTSTVKPRRQQQRCCASPEQPARQSSGAGSMLSRLVPCGADQGKVKESFAVVKRSADPRGDFRRSMAEMVVEKGIYDAADLEQLLHCFLSLNSRHHHRAIVAAFADIWEALFPESSPHHVSSSCCKE